MKYTIEGFDQEQLVNWNLDSNDAIILRWYVDFYLSGKMAKVEYEGETYLWVNYQSCINDLPIMNITNKQVLARHFKKFVKCGLMKPYISRKKGIYTCFKLVESEYQKLIEKVEGLTQNQGVDSKVDRGQLKSQEGVDSKVETKDNSINKDSSIKPLLGDSDDSNGNGKLDHKSYKEKVKTWFKDNKEMLKEDYFELWEETYPNINVTNVVNDAYTWLLSNPEKQRSKFVRYLNGYLAKAQRDYNEKHS